MKSRFLLFLAVALLLLATPQVIAQNPYVSAPSQSQTVSTIAPPVNTPLLGSGLSCVGAAGSFSAGQLVVAYTYTGVASASESKASADGGTTLTTIVTCPASGTLTIPSPPLPPGCPSSICAGWRPYVIASSSGTGAELLQTISSTTCPLSATAALTSCQLGQNFTEASLGAGAAEPTNPTLFLAPVAGTTMGAFNALSEANLSLGSHFLTWTTTGTAATCTIAVQTSSDNITFNTIGTAQTCTSSGSYLVSAATANFARVNLTAFTATGANVPSIVYTLVEGPTSAPTYIVQNCGTTATCTPNATLTNAQIKIVYGTCTLAGNSCALTGIAPAFSSTTSYSCTVTDQTTAQLVKAAPVSGSAVTFSDTVGGTDVITYICIGT